MFDMVVMVLSNELYFYYDTFYEKIYVNCSSSNCLFPKFLILCVVILQQVFPFPSCVRHCLLAWHCVFDVTKYLSFARYS